MGSQRGRHNQVTKPLTAMGSALCILFFFFKPLVQSWIEKKVIFHIFPLSLCPEDTFSMFRIFSLGFTHNHVRVIIVKNELANVSKSTTVTYQAPVDSSPLPSERMFGSCNVFLPKV